MTGRKPNPQLPILLVDDEVTWLRSLTVTLKSAGFNHFLQCSDGREVMATLERHPVSLVLLDLIMPYFSGEELLTMIAEEHPELPVIVLSGLNQLETAVKCMRLGAFDYFVKTAEKERLLTGIQRALAFRELRQENRRLRDHVLEVGLEHAEAFAGISIVSPRMQAVCRYLEAVAVSREPLLITGESGVGKELVSRAVHRLSRADRPLVAVNVGGLDDNVFSDTLFGHCRGAFTGAERERPGLVEKAQDGILFLDEIGDLSSASQVKLLRLLQEGEFFPLGSDTPKKTRARIICATNHSLEEKISAGLFRKDLFYRLCSHHVIIPPLRERSEDIPLLLNGFVAEAANSMGKPIPAIPDEIPVLLKGYDFPGNVRELRAMACDAVSLHRSGRLSTGHFRKAIERTGRVAMARPATSAQMTSMLPVFPGISAEKLPTLEEAGNMLVAEAIRQTNGNRTAAARKLGITRQALSKRLKKMEP